MKTKNLINFDFVTLRKICQNTGKYRCVKNVRIRSFSGPYFPHSTEYGEILRTSPCSVQMRKNTDQKNSQYRLFSCSVRVRWNPHSSIFYTVSVPNIRPFPQYLKWNSPKNKVFSFPFIFLMKILKVFEVIEGYCNN